MNEMGSPLLDRAVSALGNGVAQGLCLTLAVALALRLFRRTNATTRHLVQFATLVVVAALPLLNFRFADLHSSSAGASRDSDSRTDEASLTPGSFDGRGAASAIRGLAEPRDPADSLTARGNPADSSASLRNSDVLEGRELEKADLPLLPSLGIPGDGTAEKAPASKADKFIAGILSRSVWQLRLPQPWLLGAACLWLGIAAVRLCRLAAQCLALRRLKRDGESAPASVLRQFESLKVELRIRRPIELRLASGFASPMVVGFRRPAVVIPIELADAEGVDWERMFRHELAHLARLDDWSNLIQQGLKALWFFHPAVLWLSRRLTVDREIACDDHVLSATGAPRAYALFLTEFARRTRGPVWAAAPGAWSNPSQLTERINMLLDTRRNASPRLAPARAGAWTTFVITIALLGFYGAPRLAVAGAPETAGAATPSGLTASENSGSDVSAPKVKSPKAEPDPLVLPAPAPEAAPVPSALPQPPSPDLVPPAPATPIASHSARRSSASAGAVTVFSSPDVHTHAVVRGTPSSLTLSSTGEAGPQKMVWTAGVGESSEAMENRLRRLEKLVAELQQKGSKAKLSGAYKSEDPSKKEDHPQETSKAKTQFEGLSEMLARVNEMVASATREAEHAAHKAAENAMKLAMDSHKNQNPNQNVDVDVDGVIKKQAESADKNERMARRRALDAERRTVQKQISELESQLGRLEGQLERLDEGVEQREEREVEVAKEQARAERLKVRAAQRAVAAKLKAERDAAKLHDSNPPTPSENAPVPSAGSKP